MSISWITQLLPLYFDAEHRALYVGRDFGYHLFFTVPFISVPATILGFYGIYFYEKLKIKK